MIDDARNHEREDCNFMLGAKNSYHITSIRDGAGNDLLNWRRHADRILEGKRRKTRHTETKTCVETLNAVRSSRCGGKGRFPVSLQRQKPVLPTV
jgi:hypothetical protein